MEMIFKGPTLSWILTLFKNKGLQKIILYSLLLAIVFLFFHNNTLNFTQEKKIQHTRINHPTYLFYPEFIQLQSFGFSNFIANMYWLQTIQYIGSHIQNGEYKQHLAELLNIIIALSPNFEDAYIKGILLLPDNENTILSNTAISFGLEGIQKFCDLKKIQLISEQNNLKKIQSQEIYQNPCASYKIPYFLAYIYQEYSENPKKSALLYKIVVAQEDAPTGAKNLAAIMQSRSGERGISLSMFLSLAESVGEEDSCQIFVTELKRVASGLQDDTLSLNQNIIKNIQNAFTQALNPEGKITTRELMRSGSCSNFVIKAIREINLLYLETTYTTGAFFPRDPQQYPDMGMIYEFDEANNKYELIFKKK